MEFESNVPFSPPVQVEHKWFCWPLLPFYHLSMERLVSALASVWSFCQWHVLIRSVRWGRCSSQTRRRSRYNSRQISLACRANAFCDNGNSVPIVFDILCRSFRSDKRIWNLWQTKEYFRVIIDVIMHRQLPSAMDACNGKWKLNIYSLTPMCCLMWFLST